MCVPGCQETVLRRLGRRGFVRGAGLVAAAGAAAPLLAARPAPAQSPAPRSFSAAIDLTHTLDEAFPTFSGQPQLALEELTTFQNDGYQMYRWLLAEHTGTHMDAPFHFSEDGPTADEVPIDSLVVPLAVIDIAARAAEDPDTQLTPDDILAWEAEHGPLPEGACVAMNSGWDRHVGTDMFRNADADGGMHFPGFHPEATDLLAGERNANGIVVDTLSLDYGQSQDFGVHFGWLPSNRWGMEAVANLSRVPASGATIVAGGPKIRGATGGPSRVIALV